MLFSPMLSALYLQHKVFETFINKNGKAERVIASLIESEKACTFHASLSIPELHIVVNI